MEFALKAFGSHEVTAPRKAILLHWPLLLRVPPQKNKRLRPSEPSGLCTCLASSQSLVRPHVWAQPSWMWWGRLLFSVLMESLGRSQSLAEQTRAVVPGLWTVLPCSDDDQHRFGFWKSVSVNGENMPVSLSPLAPLPFSLSAFCPGFPFPLLSHHISSCPGITWH